MSTAEYSDYRSVVSETVSGLSGTGARYGTDMSGMQSSSAVYSGTCLHEMRETGR
ncbi:MAG: hypothetical protein IJ079_02255 [Lachnospiraceae bacterium]|nr:hypothetical protein [Lachnospiraceae bacterium]